MSIKEKREGGPALVTTSNTGAALASSSDAQPSSTPVEMNYLQSAIAAEESLSQPQSQSLQQQQQDEPDTTAGAAQIEPDTTSSTPTGKPTLSPPTRLNRLQSEAGLGPATDSPIYPPPPPSADRGPTLSISLMLQSGARHPYKIDEKYLRSRKVEVGSATSASNAGESSGVTSDFDPREISCYKLKELIWTDWRQEWEPRPASPSAIRLIVLGRMLEDKAALKGRHFICSTLEEHTFANTISHV